MRPTLMFALLSIWPPLLQGQELTRRLDSLVHASIADLNLAGVSVVVLRGSDTLAWQAAGYSDLENSVRADLNTVYRVGSITKQYTAAAILQQVEKGSIALDDKIGKFLPECSKYCGEVTVRQLLNHTSGIKNFTDLGDPFLVVYSRDLAQRDVLALVTGRPLDFRPGTRWSYNNSGYYLLGVILERVTTQPYAEYLKEHLWGPAGLEATRYCDARPLIAHRARGYDAVGSSFTNAGYHSTTVPFSAAGLCSTAGDLVRWARALRSGTVISPAAYRSMTTPTGAAKTVEQPYGMGAWVTDAKGRRYVSLFGQMDGFNAVLWDTPTDSLTIAVLTNTSGTGSVTLGRQLSSVLLGTPAPSIEKTEEPPGAGAGRALTATERRRYIGRYRLPAIRDGDPKLGGTVTLHVFDENGRLTAQLTGDRPEPLSALGGHRFVYAGRPDVSLTFFLHQGRAGRARIVAPDGSAEGPRIGQ
jgi:CubicO group peptidase (beta-lactamase class C family)